MSVKLLTKDLINKFSILNWAQFLSSGIFQIYLVFISAKRYTIYFSGANWINLWKSNGMLEKDIEKITKSESNFPPTFFDHFLLSDINFNGHCLINNNISILKKVINLYFPYTLSPGLSKDFTLKNWLFGCLT